jgi:16S rRNA (cytosine967-C5)-methyltransferase
MPQPRVDLHAVPGLPARAAAALALQRVERDRAYVIKALEETGRELGLADPALRADATELALGTWRWRGVVDARLEPLLPRGLASLDDLTRQLLRLATYELLGPHPVPPHAAVHVAVEAVKRLGRRGLAGLTNAVLHRLAPAPGRAAMTDGATQLDHAFPTWLRDHLAAAWGAPQLPALARWSLAVPTRTIRLRRGRLAASAALPDLPGASPSPHAPEILRLAAGAGDLRRHPWIVAGRATVQEEGAFLAAERLPLAPGARVLDACAGRGTKTAALAEREPGLGRLVATDVHPDKLARVAGELARLGLPVADCRAVDWSVGAGGLAGPFDAVLVDAPCSGTGTLSRRPEIRWRLVPEDVVRLVELQAAILRRTAELVAPGGALLYVVCSLLPDEGTSQVRSFLTDRPQFSADPAPWPAPWRRLDVGAALFPPDTGTDGFYAALLRRTT